LIKYNDLVNFIGLYLLNAKCPLWVGSGKFSPKCLDLTIGDGYRPLADALSINE